MKQDTDRGVIVIGEPGAGKSALTAQLICSRSSNPFIHKRIIGYHLCKHADKATQDPGRFVRNLVDLMARRVPEYGMLVSNSSFILSVLERSCLRDPFECFEQAVMAPLLQLKGEPQFYFIVIDALDECLSDSGGTTIVQFIRETSSKLPKWIKLIMTSRNDSNVLRHFSHVPKVYMSSTDARNLQDIEIFITTKLFEEAPVLHRLKVALGFSSGEEISFLTRKLLSQSQGNFLFVKEMFHFWEDDLNNDADLKQLPKTIGGIYENYLKRVYGSREKFKSALAILEIMVAAFEPMQVDRVFQVLKMQNIDYEYDFVYALKDLSHFIRYGEDNAITIFHLSFTEWLTSNENLGNPYYVSLKRGHKRLAEYYLSLVKTTQNSAIDVYRLAQHITFGEGDDNFLEEFGNIKASYINASIDGENRTLLHLAAENSNRKILELLVPAFDSVDCEDNYGFTPGFVAAKSGLKENVEFLVGKGANIEHQTKPPPSFYSLLNSSVLSTDPIERAKTNLWNSTMMHAAASGGHTAVIRALLKRNASFRGVNGVNLTAIQLAAQNGHLDIVQLLYYSGANVDHLCLQHAAHAGHTDVVKFLMKIGIWDICMRCDGIFYWLGNKVRYQAGPSYNFKESDGYILADDDYRIKCQSALHLAVAEKHIEVVKLLLSVEDKTIHCKDFTGRTPLHEAIRQNHVEISELLIRSGARVSQKCMQFQNLSFVCNNSMKKCNQQRIYLSKRELEEYEKDLCHCGTTPFLLAARYGHIEVASLLLRYGAKGDDKDCQGATVLHIAACHGHYDLIRWLISQRTSLHLNMKSKNLSTPLHSGAICKINRDITPLLDMGANIYETDENGMTPLHYTVINAYETDSIVLFRRVIANGSLFTTVLGSKGDITVTRNSDVIYRTLPLNFQCSKLIDIIESSNNSYINAMDINGRTALHLAAKNGEECCVKRLLEKRARADLSDLQGNIPLDLATEVSTELSECSWCNNKNDFDTILAVNQRYHYSIVDILLSREVDFSQICDEEKTRLLLRAFEIQNPVIAYLILSKGHSLSCKDAQGRTPLLTYLQNGGKWLDVILERFNVPVHIECGKPFNMSEFHLLAFRKPTVPSENLLEYHTSDYFYCFAENGPAMKAIKAHPLGFRVIDECRDAEGYTALHRAAQGGNLLALKRFLSLGADPSILTSQGNSALEIAIMCAGISPFPSNNHRGIAEESADLLLQASKRFVQFDVGCNRTQTKLTIYHLSAHRGLSGFVRMLLNDTGLKGIDPNCSNLHGITPLYLAKLYVGTIDTTKGERDYWQEVTDLIESHGGVLSYPNREVELHVIYQQLYGSNLEPFTLGEFAADGEQFYKNKLSICTEHDMRYYSTGEMINPYDAEVHATVRQIIKSLRNGVVVPGQRMIQQTLEILLEREQALQDLSALFNDLQQRVEEMNLKVDSIGGKVITDKASSIAVQYPKFFPVDEMQSLFIQEKGVLRNEQRLREESFKHKSIKAIYRHKLTNLKKFWYEYKNLLKDRKKFFNLLEKYERSELCEEEFFQATLLKLAFHNYVAKSRAVNPESLTRVSLENAEFFSSRIPKEWTGMKTVGWNQAVKFLYKQATKRDLAFDYLKDLSLGSDADTRIPLSADSLFWLHFLENSNWYKRNDNFDDKIYLKYLSTIIFKISKSTKLNLKRYTER